MANLSPGIATDNRYRTVGERQIIDMLLVAAFVYELESGQRDSAVARVASALDDWIKLGLGHLVSDAGERLFDPVEVVNRMKWAGHQGLDDFWIDHFVATSRAFAGESEPRPGASRPGRDTALRFNLKMQRCFGLGAIRPGQNLRLRLPLPLSQSSQQLEIEPIISADLSARTVRSEGRLDVQFAAPPEPAVEIAASIGFTTDGRSRDDAAGALAPDRARLYLRGSEGLIRITPRIAALARSVAGNRRPQIDIATSIFHYIIDEMMCGMVHYDQVDADAPGDWVLDRGWYDCQLGSALFVSMCRACGIPARILSGHMLYELAPGFHYWAEAWIDGQGWTPFDFLTWDLSQAGRDAAWRNYFVGNIDCRMVTQCFPVHFTGPMSIRFPASWHLLNAPCRNGMDITFVDLDGSLIYRDRVTCRRIAI